MDLQSENSGPTPCDPQPSGKINKAAFKLFGKRRAGSAVPSIFSVRSRGEGGKAPAKAPLVRSKTHDGLADTTVLEGSRKEASASGDQLHTAGESAPASAPTPAPRASVPKSLSFFSLLRRNGRGGGGAEPRPPKQRKGLRGLFIRWSRRDKGGRAEQGAEPGEGGVGVMLASRSNSVEIMKEDVALSLEPQPRLPDTATATETSEGPAATPADQPSGPEDSGSSGPGDAGRSRELQDTQTEAGPVLVPRTSAPLPSQESLAPSPQKPTRAALKAKHSSPEPHLLSSTPTMTVTPPESNAADPPSEPSMDRFCSMFTDVTSLKSFDSLTGCGDIIADTEEEGASGSGTSSGTGSSSGGGGGAQGGGGAATGDRPSPARAPPPPPAPIAAPIVRAPAPPPVPSPAPVVLKAREPLRKQQGSGVVAYMGGGEEMASPDEVDDADMQGLWHMLPQKGEDSPALPRSDPASVHHALRPEKRPPPVKTLGLSKIPVSGCSKAGKQPCDAPPEEGRGKDPQDAPSNSDEGYWDSTTPGPEEESASFLSREGIPRDSCSGDALYDLYVDPEETLGGVVSDEEVTPPSAGESKLTPPSKASTFRSLRGSTSLPRDSRIPISIKQTPPSHSASQGALTPAPTPSAQTPAGRADAPRTKIPMSKVPVRRTSNKPVGTRHTPNRK